MTCDLKQFMPTSEEPSSRCASSPEGRGEAGRPVAGAQDSLRHVEVLDPVPAEGRDEVQLPGAQESESPSHVHVEVLDPVCVLIRNALTLDEQVGLCKYIEERDKTPTDRPRAMVPGPTTLVLGQDGHPQIRYDRGEDGTVVSAMVDKAIDTLMGKESVQMGCPRICRGESQLCDYKTLSMATIRYEAPGGCFPPHVDHCGHSFVFLASLGRTANFMVKGPSMTNRACFKLLSGDMLVFDASTEAQLLHSCVSIDETASPDGEALATQFPVLGKHRYGVQTRMCF